MFRRYGRILLERALWNFPVVSLLEREDIEAVLKHQSKFPLRPPTEVMLWYRQTRPDRYTTLGIVNEYVLSHTLCTCLLAHTMVKLCPDSVLSSS